MSLVELFAKVPRFFLALFSPKYLNDAIIAYGLDQVAETMDLAVNVMGGLRPISTFLSHPAFSIDTILRLFSSPKLDTTTVGNILKFMYFDLEKIERVRDIVRNVFTSSLFTADKTQAIMYKLAEHGMYDVLLDAITYDAPSASITTSTTLTTGVSVYRDLSISSGVTLTLGQAPCVLIAKKIMNYGVITTDQIKGAGGAGAYGAGSGGGGAHGIIIMADELRTGTIRANGSNGTAATGVTGNAGGAAGGAGFFWEIGTYKAGNGGNGGASGGAGRYNGGGGGGASTYVGGAGGRATSLSFPDARSLLTELFKAMIDWALVNLASKTPSTTKNFPDLGGSGGGAGSSHSSSGQSGGGGGGGGGQVVLFGNVLNAGRVEARGGAGANGYGSDSGAGGGGGGGIVYAIYKTLNGSFVFDVAGGAAGTSAVAGTAGSAGSAVTFQI